MRTLPDGFNGAVMAVESIEDAAVFLHGPGGCRVRHMVHSTAVFPRVAPGAPEDYHGIYYYGYPRVPASYLDEYDFINGAYYKLEEALPLVAARKPGLIVIIDSPGAALIGDDRERAIREAGLECQAMSMDESLVSLPVSECYGRTLRAVMEHLSPEREEPEPGTVILLGLSLLDKDWADARDELSGLLEAMGARVLCAPGAGASLEDLRRSVSAEAAVVVCPEMCAGLSEYYESKGLRIIRSPAGAPAGFDAVRAWIAAAADALGLDPSPALDRVAAAERRAYDKLTGMRYSALRMRGLRFSLAATSSVARPLAEWLYSYLSMVPAAVAVDPGSDRKETEALEEFLREKDFPEAIGREPVPCDAVLCEGVTALTMRAAGECAIAVPIGHSCMGMDDILPRPVYGIQGALYILDELMHGVRGLRRPRLPARTFLVLRRYRSTRKNAAPNAMSTARDIHGKSR